MYIETERLILREFTLDDFTALHEILSDPITMEYVDDCLSEEETREYLEEYCIEDEGAFAVLDKTTGKLIGFVEFCGGDDDPELREIGWVFKKDFCGKDFEYESGTAIIDYAFTEMDTHRIFAKTGDAEQSSLLKRLGMTQEAVLRQHDKALDGNGWRDIYCFGILSFERGGK
ncbi:MAG: GNAT family N-acetyltransferase [Defluviitaleaceae bacterium]|nr:GNAT family N-acetyltransferase [Defluviitaleaceae bacterium]